MIKFFRKIRYNLMSENKTGKYFKYAIGEIVLVVIGILIALQINNWKENRKNNLKLNSVLIALQDNLQNDTITLAHHISFTKKEVDECTNILERSRKEASTLDTLVYLGRYKFRPAWVSPLSFNTTAFESIKSSGEFNFLPDQLKKSITNVYRNQAYFLNTLNSFNSEYKNKLNMFSQSYIPSFENEKSYLAKDISWQDINKKDFAIKFDGLLLYRKTLWEFYLNGLERQNATSIDVLKLSNQELNK